jgi:S1-C subfamily serine protease
MALKRHHKIILGGITSLLIIIMIANSVFLYWVYEKENMNYNNLENKIDSLQADTQSKMNTLSENMKSVNSQVGSLNKDLTKLKTSVSSDFSTVIDSSIKSVVTIRTDISQASGFFIANGGYIITNAHVMEGAKEANVITYDGKTYTIYRIGGDSDMDLILLKIDDTSYPPLELANSDEVKIGEKVIAIGNPLGLQFSVSEGIVSAVHREGENGLNAYIQTDAALNPGNSGGPLIDSQGKVVGINNFKVGGGESLGFALESNYIKSFVNDISQMAYKKNLI